MTMTIIDAYWIVADTNPTTQVYSTASNAFVAVSAAAYGTWLTAHGPAFDDTDYGTSYRIASAANNGSGLIRITFLDTLDANVATGQKFNVAGTGVADANWVITKINSTTVDLQSSTFTVGFTTGTMRGAAIIDTLVNLLKLINTYTITTFPPNHQVITW